MDLGDIYQKGVEVISAGNYFSIQPDTGNEIVIHNVIFSGACEVYIYDGVTELLMDTFTEVGSLSGQYFHCTNTKYIRVKNTTAGNLNFYADGVYTKIA